MLRTSIFADAVPPKARRLLRTIAGLLGLAFFVGVVLSTWQPLLDAWRIGEYEGEGALRVPTWPVRGVVLFMSAFGALAYMMMIVFDWQGRLVDENEAPASPGSDR
jgi:TRAP-type C4-dicarboxylate transport system permease small subunit